MNTPVTRCRLSPALNGFTIAALFARQGGRVGGWMQVAGSRLGIPLARITGSPRGLRHASVFHAAMNEMI